jgi:hypothetical protein
VTLGHIGESTEESTSEPVFVNLLMSPGIDSQPDGPVRLDYFSYRPARYIGCVGNFSPAMGARNQVGIGLSYRPASLCSLATLFQTRFLESIPRPIAGLKIQTLEYLFLGIDSCAP